MICGRRCEHGKSNVQLWCEGKYKTTAATVELLRNEFKFVSRGELNVKGKGMMECFLFDGKKTDDREIPFYRFFLDAN